eukprot:TRINITY_DN8914_c0_g1_i2.p1 TRINITY_DN8914_c0_g1~~TRINITY_DN8914_c0_g1_i2.p1  ORF type:complete len:174 (+),score=14.37 TRINITY_DN8914_c0_g1_i2:192-713(+)
MLVMSSIVKMLPLTPSTIARSQPSIRLLQQRTIFQMWQGWMRTVWNRVDSNRQDLVGKDRLAAEWILKLGGAAELSLPPNSAKWYRNYNGLPWLGDTNRGVKPKNVRCTWARFTCSFMCLLRHAMLGMYLIATLIECHFHQRSSYIDFACATDVSRAKNRRHKHRSDKHRSYT